MACLLDTENFFRHSNGGLVIRHTFGLGNPNRVFQSLIPILFGYYYLNYEKLKKKNFIIIFFIILGIYTLTRGRAGLLVYMVSIYIVYPKKFKNFNFRKIENFFLRNLYTLFLMGTLLLSCFSSLKMVG